MQASATARLFIYDGWVDGSWTRVHEFNNTTQNSYHSWDSEEYASEDVLIGNTTWHVYTMHDDYDAAVIRKNDGSVQTWSITGIDRDVYVMIYTSTSQDSNDGNKYKNQYGYYKPDQIKLNSNIGASWVENGYDFNYVFDYDNKRYIHELKVTSGMLSLVADENNLWFRPNVQSTDGQRSPNGQDHVYSFADNLQNETYSSSVNGTTYSFGIPYKNIGASEYKITVYKYTDGGYDVKVDIVSLPTTINSSLGFATFSSNRALDLSGVNAYYASGVTNGKVVLTKTTSKVPAGTGLLLAGSGDIKIPVVPTAEASELSGNLLKASVTETEVAASPESGESGTFHYFLAGTDAASLGFYNIATTTYSAAGKAYLETTDELTSDPVTARAAWIFQDETQGINKVESTQNVDVVYDLQGRVAKTAKAGLYIKNGKKVFVK